MDKLQQNEAWGVSLALYVLSVTWETDGRVHLSLVFVSVSVPRSWGVSVQTPPWLLLDCSIWMTWPLGPFQDSQRCSVQIMAQGWRRCHFFLFPSLPLLDCTPMRCVGGNRKKGTNATAQMILSYFPPHSSFTCCTYIHSLSVVGLWTCCQLQT